MLRYFVRVFARALALGVLASSTVLVAAPTASAHERRQVGEYAFVVGWGTEPGFANQPNGPEVTITKGQKEDPVVEGVELTVDVTFGEATTMYEMEPGFIVGVFGEPGNYSSDLVPTRAGTYEFHIYGTVEGTEVDETFTSGPETFNDIEDPAEFAFPQADPNNSQLASRVQQESQRVAALESETKDDVAAARIFGVVGLIVGAVGLVAALTVGALALRKRG